MELLAPNLVQMSQNITPVTINYEVRFKPNMCFRGVLKDVAFQTNMFFWGGL